MPYEQSDRVRYFVFNLFCQRNITHAIFTRQGGFSPAPWKSLNFGGTVGDDPERVLRNQKIAFNAIGRDILSIHDLWQVHSSRVIQVNTPRLAGIPYIRADAMVTDNPEVTLLMRFADCVPILLFDPNKNVVGMVHSGWEGTVKKIVNKTITTMSNLFNCKPEDVLAGIGPSISVDQYSIGQEVEEKVRRSFGILSDHVLQKGNGTVKFDLWEANRILLAQSGVRKIETANICTASHLDDWFSHRGEGGRTGRFGAVIGLGRN